MKSFAWTLNADQMPANKGNCRKAELYVDTEDRNRDLVQEGVFLTV